MSTMSSVRRANSVWFDDLANPMTKTAAAGKVDDFIRTEMREKSFTNKILPVQMITNDDLDKQADTPHNVKIIEIQPGSPGAISVPLGTTPISYFLPGRRGRVIFSRIVGPRYVDDVDRLRTYDMDIRQLMSDNAIKDMLKERDRKFLLACNAALGGSQGATVGWTGAVQWQSVSGGVTRDGFAESKKIMPAASSLEATKGLINMITQKEFLKWDREEIGGDLAQDIMKNGFAEATVMGLDLMVTIKRQTGYVPDDAMYMFASDEYLGKSYQLEDITLFVERKAFMIEFFPYEYYGITIAHPGGLARVDWT